MNEILLTIEEKIAYLRFNRPEARNAISRNLLNELELMLNRMQEPQIYKEIRILILQGEGGLAFCSGADLKERGTMTQDEVWDFLDQFRRVLHKLETLNIPTIAAIDGIALGGGLEIALACDFRLCSESSVLGLPEAKLGIIPGAGGTQRLTRLIGESKAKELIYTGRRLDAKAAHALGVVNFIFTKETFKRELENFIQEIISSAPISIAMAKKSIQEGYGKDLEKGLDLERNYYKSTINTKDRAEALVAFREKRKPLFTGE